MVVPATLIATLRLGQNQNLLTQQRIKLLLFEEYYLCQNFSE